ncbi:autotransporter outer membrane beta-barrel domain-containing protein [Aquabacter spiritensis]|uniref:autotransporter outer membrane beta-barrel domain-containing protein n=1 Tax=Aquabacter spiritensis TaxID=933073 RepID=UPI0014053BBE|nr:autotransporter domain-containing protein [Aquabacter spiritensis]
MDYPVAEANFTGIRGANIVGNYIVPNGGGASGGILYRTDTQTWISIPTSTANGVNYPGAYTALPYGPTFGAPDGIFRLVGSYKATASSGNVGYLFDAAAVPGAQYTDIVYPSASGLTVTNTIPHSQFGNNVVGNYDTAQGTAGAFIYNAATKTYTQLSGPGAVVTSAYGIYADKVTGGYTDTLGLDAQHGFLYDMATGTFTTYDHPGAIATHFQGITGGGRHGEYNLAADWIDAQGGSHAAILHIRADGSTEWIELDVPGSTLTSIDSIYAGNAVGFYFGAEGMMNYLVTVPWAYNPIRNTGILTVSTAGGVGISGISGDDIVNDGTVLVTGAGAVGVKADTYGVVTNNGQISVTGAGAAGIQLNGLDGTLLNAGRIIAAPGAMAISTGSTASGTMVVNTGTIDGRVAFAAGPQGRFENSGWLGVSGAGAGTVHQIGGVYVQTARGTLALRVNGASADRLDVTGAARLGGTFAAAFAGTGGLQKSYTVLTATDGATGTFASLETAGLPAFFATGLTYGTNAVMLTLTSAMAQVPGLSTNQQAVGAGIDRALNGAAGTALGTLPAGLSPLYSLGTTQLPGALSALSGEAYASQRSALIGDGFYSREAVLGRLRQGAYAGTAGPLSALAYGGPAAAALAPAPGSATEALAYAAKAPEAPSPLPAGTTAWAQGFGGWTKYDGTANASALDASIGGFMSGADIQAGTWRIGAALGYSQSNASVSDLGSSSAVNSMLVALYGGTGIGPLSVRLGGTYALSQIDASRTIAFPGVLQQASAQYDGGTAQLFAEIGYGFALQAVALEPFAGLAWVHLNTDGFTESGALAAALTGGSTSSNVGYTTLGLRAATTVALGSGMTLAPHASAAWQYAFGDVDPTAQLAFRSLPGSTFAVGGVPLAENTALLEVGADLHLSTQARVGLSYVGQFADGVAVNGFQANLSWSF